MQNRMFNTRKPFDVFPPFAHHFADGDLDTGGGSETDAADDAGADDTGAGDTVPRDKFNAEVTLSKKQRKRAQDAEAALADAIANAPSEEDAALFASLKKDKEERAEAEAEAEREKDAAEGNFQKLQDRTAKTHADAMIQKDRVHLEALGVKDAEITRRGEIMAKLGAENPLQAALSKAGVQDIASALFFIQNSPASKYRAVCGEDEDGQPVPKVVDRDGNEVVDPNGEGDMMAMDGLVKHFVGTETGQRFLPPSGDKGSGGRKGGPGSDNMDTILDDPEKIVEAMQRMGGQEYVKKSLERKSRQKALEQAAAM